MWPYALTIFLGAFLLFQVQPLMGRYILPWFGGSPAVWTTCLLFFQAVLLAGYALAHGAARCLRPKAQAALYTALLAIACAWLPIIPSDAWKPQGSASPTLAVLALLVACVGPPYLVLATTSPWLQHWFSRMHPGASPYRLYALANVASLLALGSYPFFFEVHFSRAQQARLWGWGLAAYAVGGLWCALRLWRANPANPSRPGGAELPCPAPPPDWPTRSLWLLLPACASALLLAVTNKLCQDVAAIPFLWVLPLALYLLSFILCFDSPRWYARGPWMMALVAALSAVGHVLLAGTNVPLRTQLLVLAAGLFVGCMVCHGELYRLRPAPGRLTSFYLHVAAGGALGGLFVAVGAPALFTDYYELDWALVLCGALLMACCLRDGHAETPSAWRWRAITLTLAGCAGVDRALAALGQKVVTLPAGSATALRALLWGSLAVVVGVWLAKGVLRTFRQWRLVACAWLLLGVAALALTLRGHARRDRAGILDSSRTFHGTLKVWEYRRDDPEQHYLLLQHGNITHGLQFVNPQRSRWSVSYYGQGSGIALAVEALPAGPRHIGVIGLGVGTMAAFGRPGDRVRFYELNPDVHRVARSWFTYLSNSPCPVDVVLGDARLSLEGEPPQAFDLLVLDAFSSDAIPLHLLTREAFQVYERHLQPTGVLAVHISNRHLNLEPVLLALSRHFRYQLVVVNHDEEGDQESDEDEETRWWDYASTWVLMTRNGRLLETPAVKQAAVGLSTNSPSSLLWTDDFASLFQVLQ